MGPPGTAKPDAPGSPLWRDSGTFSWDEVRDSSSVFLNLRQACRAVGHLLSEEGSQ